MVSEFKIGDQVLVALDVLDIYAEDTPIPDDPRYIAKGTLVLGYSEDLGDRITAMPEMVRAVSPAPDGELRERIAKALQDATDDTNGWITRLSDEQALAIADAVLNGEGER